MLGLSIEAERLTRRRPGRASLPVVAGVVLLGLAAALPPHPAAARSASALLVPNGKVEFRADGREAVPRSLVLALSVGTPTGASDRQFPVACMSLSIVTDRAARLTLRGRVAFRLAVERDGEVVQEVTATAVPAEVFARVLVADTCGSALAQAPRLDLEEGDRLLVEARPRGIGRLRRGELTTLQLSAAGRFLTSASAAGAVPGHFAEPAGGRLQPVLVGGGVTAFSGFGQDEVSGPSSAVVGFRVPRRLASAEACLSITAFAGLTGLPHPATAVTARVVVVGDDGGRRRFRVRTPIRDREIFEMRCNRRLRDFEAGDAVTVRYRLGRLVRILPPNSQVSVELELAAGDPG